MKPWALHWSLRRVAMVCCLGILGLGPGASAQTDEIYAAFDGHLHRLSTTEHQIETIGPLTVGVGSLSFTPDGRLWGLSREGQIYEIDLATAEGRPIAELGQGDGYNFGRLTVADEDWVYAFRSVPDVFNSGELIQHHLPTSETYVVGKTFSAADRANSFRMNTLSISRGTLMGFGDERSDTKVFSINPMSGAASALSPELYVIPLVSDADSDGDLWVLSDTVVTPPDYLLGAVDPVAGTSVSEKQGYIFRHSLIFAVRKGRAGDCRLGEDALCFLDGRFRATATWRDFEGNDGIARGVPGASDSAGLMWFFQSDNWELSLKMLDGCDLNDRFWFFLSGTTNVELTVTVEDVVTGERRIYENTLGSSLETTLDTDAFSCEP